MDGISTIPIINDLPEEVIIKIWLLIGESLTQALKRMLNSKFKVDFS